MTTGRGRWRTAVAAILIVAISLTRIYLGAHYPMDVLGGWMAGGALVILVAVHVLGVDEQARRAAAAAAARRRAAALGRATPNAD